MLPVAMRDELPLIYYRKGYCALMSAAIQQNSAGFRDAAAAFDQAMSTWQGRVKAVKGKPAEPGPSVLMVLSAIGRLEAASDLPPAESSKGLNSVGVQEDLAVGVARSTCSPDLMTASACQGVLRAGREWLGWMSLQHDDVREAARDLAELQDSFWTHWVSGKQAFRDGQYMDAAIQYGAAMELWKNNQARWRGDWMARLGPKPRLGAALTDLGGARMLAGETTASIAVLDAAIAADPQNARAFYLRARAKEQAGQADAASADYNLATRTAFAGAEDLVSGEAHLYRGIQMYRRKDFERAESEFESALNLDMSSDMHADAVAWRHMAAVAGGACGASRGLLAEALGSVSPYFPKADAKVVMAACSNTL
jgi:tetratricopeptide (TPR) repeat protein